MLDEVDASVRSYAKEKKIPIRELNRTLTDYDSHALSSAEEQVITYLPSRSNSDDGRLLKLKKKDPVAYDHVLHNKLALKEALPPPVVRKKIPAIDALKNKFSSLSKEEREAFLAWVEQEELQSA